MGPDLNTYFLRLMIVLLALGGTTSAYAQSDDWHVTGSIVYNDDDADRAVDDSLSGLNVTVGRNLTRNLTLEGLLGYSDINAYCDPVDCYPDQTHLDVSANILAFYDRDATFAPYAMVGIGYLGKEADEGPQYVRNSGTDNRPTYSFGLGLKWRLGDKFSIRSEYRTRNAVRSGHTFDDRLITIGVQYAFGGGAPKRDIGIPQSDKPVDTDDDGVLDMWDACPDTPEGVDVTSRGCEIQNIDRDSDNDRVPDSRDECPNTPPGVPVGATGCSLDSDMDGVVTGNDRCPGTRPGAEVDTYGCELIDDDNDGVPNTGDSCPSTRAGAEVDPVGCEIRDVISLPGVNFQSGSDMLAPGAEDLIRQIADTLRDNAYLQIEVAGHTDSQGDEIGNQGLSDRRAKTVFDYLFLYGVDPKRLSFRGYGESQAIADNETREGRAINRRVELRVIRQ